MTRHTPNRPDNKNSVMTRLGVQQEEPSSYRLLRYWVSVMMGLLSVGLLLQRYRGAMPVHAAPLLSPVVTLSDDSRQSPYDSQCAGITPLLLSSAVAYQTGHSALGLLSSVAFWLARPVSAQVPDVSVVVPEFRVNSNVTGDQYPAVTSLGNGEWVVVVQTGNYDIYAQRCAGNGSLLGSEFRVNSNVTSYQYSPAVTSLGSGEWVVVWNGYQTGNSDIYAQRYAVNGSRLGSEFRVNNNVTNSQRIPTVTSLGTGEWVVVWDGAQTGNSDIYAQRYAGNGSPLGSEFRVNSNVTSTQSYPAVTSLGSGEWVVVWVGDQTGDYDIYAQRYVGNGSVLGSEFRVNSNVTGSQYFPAVTSLGSGEWVVVWQGAQTGNRDIYTQRYSVNGSLLGSEFRVNSVLTGNQDSPAVTSLGTGEWLVVWAGNSGIYAQRYAGNGSRLGSEFRVNSNVTSIQEYPAVTSLDTGEWVVVWGGIQTGYADIYGSIFSSVAPLSTTVFPTPSSSPATTTLSSAVTTELSSTSPTSPSTTTTNDPTMTSAITSSVNTFTSSVSAAMTVATTTPTSSITPGVSSASLTSLSSTTTDNPTNTPAITSSIPLVTPTNANAGVSGAVIGAAVGAGGFALAACLGAIGFYAYRKKSRAGQANHAVANEAVGTPLKPVAQMSAQPASEYAQVNLKDANQSDNHLPVSHSPYGRLDEMKKQEKEYDHAPTF